MKIKIYAVLFASWENKTNNLCNRYATAMSQEKAREIFRETVERARLVAANENDDLGNGINYDVYINEQNNEATITRVTINDEERYTAKVQMMGEVIEATDHTMYGMTLREVREEIAKFTGNKKGEAMRKAKIFARHISIDHVCHINLSYGFSQIGLTKHEDPNWLIIQWTNLDGDTDKFYIIE